MNTLTRIRASSVSLILVLLTGVLMLSGCDKKTSDEAARATASPSTVTDANLATRIEQASTPADHEELAAYYETRAREAELVGAQERELRGRYERRWQPDHHPMGPGARRHYEGLIEGHEESANHYRAMGQWHRRMAEGGNQAPAEHE